MAFINWLKDIFDKYSSVSSKRVGAILLIVWGLIIATFVIIKSLCIPMDPTASGLIQFIIGTGAAMLIGGTVAERIGKADKPDKTNQEE